jgi:hypothetical protein
MLQPMICSSPRELSSAFSSVVLACALALACVTATGCKKDDKGDGDAAADAAAAAADATVADAAVADAGVDAADAAPAPLTTAATARPTGKPKLADPPICAAARSAKQRNSPAAPGLERQCVQAGGTM